MIIADLCKRNNLFINLQCFLATQNTPTLNIFISFFKHSLEIFCITWWLSICPEAFTASSLSNVLIKLLIHIIYSFSLVTYSLTWESFACQNPKRILGSKFLLCMVKLKVTENLLYFHNKTSMKILPWELATFLLSLVSKGSSLISCDKELTWPYFHKLTCIQFRSQFMKMLGS